MTYALIDNATLTAVQRIEGKVKTRSKDSVDTDLVAFENFVQAILFYDDLLAVDDYIPEHRDGRLSAFPYLRFLSASEFNLDAIETTAAEKASEIRPEIRGGEFVNEDFRRLLELLQMHIVCTWDISSSIYYLTLKGLIERDSQDFEKYGKLAAAIFAELTDTAYSGGVVNSDVQLVDRYGKPITKGYKVPGARWGDGSTGGVTPAINAFVASLVWLANRSIFYSLSASYLKADTFLYPIRQAYQQHYLAKSCGYGVDYPRRIVEHFSTSLAKDLIDIQNAGLATAIAINLPVFIAWICKETGDPAQILGAALDLREQEEFVEARGQLREVRRLYDETGVVDANKAVQKIIAQIEKTSNRLRVKYGIETKQGVPLTRLVHVYNTYAAISGLPQLPVYDFKVKLPGFLSNLDRQTGFGAVYRNIGRDLSSIWSLGEFRDILGRRVVKDRDAFSYNPKNEEPRYRHAHSPIKSPM